VCAVSVLTFCQGVWEGTDQSYARSVKQVNTHMIPICLSNPIPGIGNYPHNGLWSHDPNTHLTRILIHNIHITHNPIHNPISNPKEGKTKSKSTKIRNSFENSKERFLLFSTNPNPNPNPLNTNPNSQNPLNTNPNSQIQIKFPKSPNFPNPIQKKAK
jgi:hypothetical protein